MQHFPLVNKLHTDVLEEKYGPISSVVLKHDKIIRAAHLVDRKGVCRTFALTFFPKNTDKRIFNINNEISSGKPIGVTFREHGYIIRKNVIDVFVIEIPKWLKGAFKTREKYAKARLSEFYAKRKDESPIIYGIVIEIYSPDFRAPEVNSFDISQINPTTKIFHKFGVSKNEIWKRIGKDNNWRDIGDKYTKAKNLTFPLIFKLKKEILNILKSGKFNTKTKPF
jgi:hypothetical protein